MNKGNKKILGNILLVLAMTIIVFFIVLNDNLKEMIPIVLNIKKEYLILCLIITLLWQFLIGVSLTIFTCTIKKDYKLSSGFLNALVATLFNDITPSATGGQIAQMFVFKKQGLESGDALSVLWTEFIMYQSTMCVFSLVLIILKFNLFLNQYSHMFIFVILGFILNSIVIVGLILLARYERFQNWITTKGINIAEHFHLIKNKEETINNLNEQLYHFRKEASNLKYHKKEFITCVLLCVLRLICYYSIPYIVFISLGSPISFELFFNCLAIGSFVAIISNLIPIPGASGGTELAFVSMFAYVFSSINAKTAVLIWRFFSYYLMMLVGAIAYAYYKFKEN